MDNNKVDKKNKENIPNSGLFKATASNKTIQTLPR